MALFRSASRQFFPGLQMLLEEACYLSTKAKGGTLLLRTSKVNGAVRQYAPSTVLATHRCFKHWVPDSHPVSSDDKCIILSSCGRGLQSRHVSESWRGYQNSTSLYNSTLAQSSKITPGDSDETLKDDLPSQTDASEQNAGDNDDINKDDRNRDEENDNDEDEPLVAKYDESGKPLSNWTRMKMMMKAYSFVIIPVHWIIAPLWFGSFYYTVKMGVDVAPVLLKIGISEAHVSTLKTSGASNALMAYALYKIFTPLRYTVTVGATEMTIRYLRRKGYIKHAPQKEKTYRQSLKETVQEVKEKIDRKS